MTSVFNTLRQQIFEDHANGLKHSPRPCPVLCRHCEHGRQEKPERGKGRQRETSQGPPRILCHAPAKNWLGAANVCPFKRE